MNKWTSGFLISLLCLQPMLNAAPEFKPVREPAALSFPRDHGAHPEYKTEWWYFVGHLKSEDGRMFGFELTFFRIGVNPSADKRSAWAAPSLYLAHFAVTTDEPADFFYAERSSRGEFKNAGAQEGKLEVWIGDWVAAMVDGGKIRLTAKDRNYGLSLELVSTKPVVLHGKNGFSRKGKEPDEASLYSSLTSLEGKGLIRAKGVDLKLSEAKVWMDHEVTSADLPADIQGWDWFAVQLEGGEELMLYQLRDKAGRKGVFSSGTYVDAAGRTQTLKAQDFEIKNLSSWTSPQTGTSYPASWQIESAALGLKLDIRPVTAAQELQTERTTGVTYWEGRCKVAGTRRGEAVKGDAYAELTGYSGKLSFEGKKPN